MVQQILRCGSLKLKGPARHWLNSLPAESIGCWEDLESAFLDNFQGTYVQPLDADDLSHIIQQPEESARQFWTRFLTKKNQIVDCPDAEALAAFKHNIRNDGLPGTLDMKSRIHGSPHDTHDPLLRGRRQLASS